MAKKPKMPAKLEMVVLRAPPRLVAELGPEMVAAGPAAGGLRPMGRASPGTRAKIAENATVEVQHLDSDERSRVLADPATIAVLPRMPVSLIKALKASLAAVKAGPQATNWGIQAVNATNSPVTGAGITVAVLDTGIDETHPAFAGVDLVQRNFTTEAAQDLNGHGTHCAGTIFGRDVDGHRIGIARGVTKALIGKVLGAGGGASEQIINAITWAQLEGAQVISMSLGMDFPGYQKQLVEMGYPGPKATSLALAGYRLNTRLFDEWSQALIGHDGVMAGSVVTAAAGNESHRPGYTILLAPPATGRMFVSVAAIGQDPGGAFHVAYFSNEGATLAAPGEDIWSAKRGGGLTAMSGTSMATPHVAGVAALWAEFLGRNAPFSAASVVDRMKQAVRALPFSDTDVGLGLVQAPNGVLLAGGPVLGAAVVPGGLQ